MHILLIFLVIEIIIEIIVIKQHVLGYVLRLFFEDFRFVLKHGLLDTRCRSARTNRYRLDSYRLKFRPWRGSVDISRCRFRCNRLGLDSSHGLGRQWGLRLTQGHWHRPARLAHTVITTLIVTHWQGSRLHHRHHPDVCIRASACLLILPLFVCKPHFLRPARTGSALSARTSLGVCLLVIAALCFGICNPYALIRCGPLGRSAASHAPSPRHGRGYLLGHVTGSHHLILLVRHLPHLGSTTRAVGMVHEPLAYMSVTLVISYWPL